MQSINQINSIEWLIELSFQSFAPIVTFIQL
jgi:hypothetical protein